MTLRPRYSLLTLLLLTAAIAVGIKLWRGPHHVSFSKPSTWMERQLFENAHPAFTTISDKIECEYTRHLTNTEIHYIAGQPRNVFIATFKDTNDYFGEPIISIHNTQELAKEQFRVASKKRIVFWIDPGCTTKPDSNAPRSMFLVDGKLKNAPPYFITEEKLIYSGWFYANRIQLSEIPFHSIRVRLLEEHANIPDPQ